MSDGRVFACEPCLAFIGAGSRSFDRAAASPLRKGNRWVRSCDARNDSATVYLARSVV